MISAGDSGRSVKEALRAAQPVLRLHAHAKTTRANPTEDPPLKKRLFCFIIAILSSGMPNRFRAASAGSPLSFPTDGQPEPTDQRPRFTPAL